ncbi:hypothetical protein BGX20_007563, partial [Mortierella sp. AD010]
MFEQLDNSKRTSEQERSIEIYGLHPRTDEFRIQSAMAQFGDVEKVSIRPCRNGVKTIARVTYSEAEDVKKVLESKRKWVFVGNDLVRVSKVGTEKVRWELNFIGKLSNLPYGTTPLDLQLLLEGNKAEYITIPRTYGQEGKFVKRQREAFIYFSSQSDMEEAMEVPLRIGGRET